MSTDRQVFIHRPDDDRVFVFGSNRAGIHGGGAAWYAHNLLHAEWGVGEGPTGRTYALPTCSLPGMPLTLDEVARHVDAFLAYARLCPDTRFFVSEVGCGLAGFDPKQISPLFAKAPDNCDLPNGWRKK